MLFRFTKSRLCLAVLLPSFLMSSVARSHSIEEPDFFKSELTGGLNSAAGFVRINLVTESSIQYSFTGSYSYSLSRQFQIGFQGAVSDSGAPFDSFRYAMYIPFTVNWGGNDLRDDFFGRVSPGITYDHALNTALLLQFGKRFKILDNISWRPTVGISGVFGNGDPRTAIDIIPLAFSIVF